MGPIGLLCLASAVLTHAAIWSLPSADASHAREVTIAATGDVLIHRKVIRAAEAHGWAHVFGGLKQTLRRQDIGFANLETPLVDDLRAVRGGDPPVLGAPIQVAASLAQAGVNVVGCANNHAYDQGPAGADRTVRALEAAGLVSVGVHTNRDTAYRHRLVERDGVRVAFLSYTEQVNRGRGGHRPAAHIARLDDRRRLAEAIAEARDAADIVALAVHWSGDFVFRPRIAHRRLARQWVEAGVDVILGTGPHVLQHVERLESPRGDAVVAYSLGNLVSNQGQRHRVGRTMSPRAHPAMRLAETRDGVVLRVPLRLNSGRIRVNRLTAEPLWTENNFYWWWENPRRRSLDIRVVRLASTAAATRTERLPMIASALGPHVRVLDGTSDSRSGSAMTPAP